MYWGETLAWFQGLFQTPYMGLQRINALLPLSYKKPISLRGSTKLELCSKSHLISVQDIIICLRHNSYFLKGKAFPESTPPADFNSSGVVVRKYKPKFSALRYSFIYKVIRTSDFMASTVRHLLSKKPQ